MRQIWVACVMILTALSSAAATLGQLSGEAVLGQGLDVRVPVTVAAGADASQLCLGAYVFYGDEQLAPGRLRLTPQNGAEPNQVWLRIQSFQPINEPIVTLEVRAGCGAPFSRRYALLADPPPELAARAIAAPVGVQPVLAPQVPPPNAVALATGLAGDAAPGPAAPARAALPARAAAAGPPVRPRENSVLRRAAAPVRASEPRLQLDPLDLSLDGAAAPRLELSRTLHSQPGTPEASRAAALLWQAINAAPEDRLRQAHRLVALEAQSRALLDAQAQDRAQMAALERQLQAAQRSSQMHRWLYLLGALLALALLALLLWRRQQRVVAAARPAWWAAQAEPASGKMARIQEPVAASPALEKRLHARRDGVPQDDELESGPQALGLGHAQALAPVLDNAPAWSASERRDFGPSLIGASRSLATEELFDVQQQADFFVSIGQDEQAIQILTNHILESQQPSALIYLDLLKIFHRLGQKSDYERLRVEFNRLFNAGVPAFEQYADRGRNLEAYEAAFSRIQALWPQPRVLDVIEQSIFRDPNDPQAEVFDLDAYRELLLLHALAQDIIRREAGVAAPVSDFEQTRIKPLKAAAAALAPVRADPDRDLLPPASARLGLDIDLNEWSQEPAVEPVSPKSAVLTPGTSAAQPAQQGKPPFFEGEATHPQLLDFEFPPEKEPGQRASDRA